MEPKEKILDAAERYFEEVRELRRDLHQHPELSFQEFRSSQRIAQKLGERGIPFSDGWVGSGLVGWIKGGKDDPTVALRGDMDALPIDEQNELSYRSCHEGVMHACGHDVHSSCLYGAAMILQDLADDLDGTVRL
ncbi:MAG: M20 family metallopeptidase, partial [Flavobacteriales bacterium]